MRTLQSSRASGRFGLLASAVCASLLLSARPCPGQGIDLSNSGITPAGRPQRVTFSPDPLSLRSGKADWVELRFHVEPGFHVNSHEPGDETLIPTSLQLAASPQYRLLRDEYPAGTPLRLAIGTGETLSTYGGEFRVRLQILAGKGEGTVAGTLHYQACNAASCFPPRDLPFSVPFTAR